MEDRLRRKKGYDDMISGKIAVDLLLEDEASCPDEHAWEVSFVGDSLSSMIVVTICHHNKATDKRYHSGAINITRPHFHGIVSQLGKMKSMLNTMKGENK